MLAENGECAESLREPSSRSLQKTKG